MQGVIFDIKRFAIHDGPGVRTTVFLKGCPLKCQWCHNPESISSEIEHYKSVRRIGNKEFERDQTIGYSISVNEVMREIEKEKVFMEEGCGGVTLSGGEPLFQSDFALAILKACKEEGLHTVVDTSGFVSEKIITEIIPYTDLFLYDIKLSDARKHKEFTGVENKVIWKNLKLIIENKTKVIIRIPVIPSVNSDEMDLISKKLEVLKTDCFNEIHLLPYHKIGAAKYERFQTENKMLQINEPEEASLEAIADVFIKKGFNVEIHN